MLTEYVKERLARLLAENAPRRVQPASPVHPPTRSTPPAASPGGPEHGAPDLLPSDDEDEGSSIPSLRPQDTGPRRSRADPDSATPAQIAATPAQESLLLTSPTSPRRPFGRAHLGVVSALLVIGLLCAGWSILRARPVAMASGPAALPSIASPGAAPSRNRSSSASASATAAPPILVHVLGAVRHPGVVTLRQRARVRDAIAAAGGLTGQAAPRDLNLAQVLEDGQQVVIGTERKPSGEVRSSSGSSSAGPDDAGGAAQTGGGALVNLNSASQTQLEDLPGVGPVTAAKIVAWRTEHHRFSRVEELQEVDGIGPKTYADIAPHARV